MKIINQIFPLHNLPPIKNTIVPDLTARDNISSDYRYIGMKVYVISEDKDYKLVSGILNTDWIELSYGGNTPTTTLDDAYNNYGTDPKEVIIDDGDLIFHTNNSSKFIVDNPNSFYGNLLELNQERIVLKSTSAKVSTGDGLYIIDQADDSITGAGVKIFTEDGGGIAGDILIKAGESSSGKLSLESILNIDFKDSEIRSATVSDSIPLSIQTTVDYGTGTNVGDLINDFRTAFTDEAIINAIMENHKAIIGGPVPSTLKIETFTLTSTDLSNGKLVLSENIIQTELYSVNLNGSILFQGNDYTIQNTKDIVFTFSQNQLLTEGDMIQIMYKF